MRSDKQETGDTRGRMRDHKEETQRKKRVVLPWAGGWGRENCGRTNGPINKWAAEREE